MIAQIENVHKRLGRTKALKGVSLKIEDGETLALLGPNGAGKTTLVSLLVGLRSPDRGKVKIGGGDPRNPRVRQILGVTPQGTGFPPNLRVGEIIDLVRAHYTRPIKTKKVLEQFSLTDLAKRTASALSGGQARKLAVALAFVGNPKLVVLDEPTTGLDVESRRTLWRQIKHFRATGGTVLLTTHYLEEAEELADRVIVLAQGKKIAEGSPEEIKQRVQVRRVRLRAEKLPPLACADKVEFENGRYSIWTHDSDSLVRQLIANNIDFSDLEILPISLEEAFLALLNKKEVL